MIGSKALIVKGPEYTRNRIGTIISEDELKYKIFCKETNNKKEKMLFRFKSEVVILTDDEATICGII